MSRNVIRSVSEGSVWASGAPSSHTDASLTLSMTLVSLIMRRTRLRTRVLLLTGAFACALFAVTWALSSRALMPANLAVAWIIVMVSFAAVQLTLRKVVRPIEDLSRAADRIANGDFAARAPVAGDYEIASLGAAVNRMADELRAHARTDELTALPNFRAFREKIDDEIARASRYNERFGILVLDLDRFKKYNDTYGHLAGNDALQRVAAVMRQTVRTVDFPARYGGEEFAVIVPQIDIPSLAAIAERIRAGVEATTPVTVSIGAAVYPDDAPNVDALF